MKRSFVILAIFVISTMLVLSACASTPAGTTRPAAPAAFANKTNPVAGNPDAIAKGKSEYAGNCASCHGESGGGDGPAASALTPKPSNLKLSAKETTSGYLFWRTSDGGGMEPFRSSMPAFKAVLSEEKIWQVVSYIQSWK